MEESDKELTQELASTFLEEIDHQEHDIVEGPAVPPDGHPHDNQDLVPVDNNNQMNEEDQFEALAISGIDSQQDRSTSRRVRDRGGKVSW